MSDTNHNSSTCGIPFCNDCFSRIKQLAQVAAGMHQKAHTATNERVKPTHKCDLCGSTAIDHTEMHCQMNRMGKNLLSKEKPYICPQCGEDDRGSAEHAWYAHTLDGLEGKPYPYKEAKVERR